MSRAAESGTTASTSAKNRMERGRWLFMGRIVALCLGELTRAKKSIVLAAFPLRRAALGWNGADGWAGSGAAGTDQP